MVSIRKKCRTIFLDNLHPIFMSELHTSELLTYFEMLLFGRENNIALKEGQPASTQTNKYIPCSKIKIKRHTGRQLSNGRLQGKERKKKREGKRKRERERERERQQPYRLAVIPL